MRKMQFLTNLNAIDCCQATINEKLINFPTIHANCKTIWAVRKFAPSLESALLGKTHALLQDALTQKWFLIKNCVKNLLKQRTEKKDIPFPVLL